MKRKNAIMKLLQTLQKCRASVQGRVRAGGTMGTSGGCGHAGGVFEDGEMDIGMAANEAYGAMEENTSV